MRMYSEPEMATYIARGEPFDKARAYAIQDEAFHPVPSYGGSYCYLVRLPLRALVGLWCRAGLDITNEHLAGLPAERRRCPIEVSERMENG